MCLSLYMYRHAYIYLSLRTSLLKKLFIVDAASIKVLYAQTQLVHPQQ